jgi:hypothetical protein
MRKEERLRTLVRQGSFCPDGHSSCSEGIVLRGRGAARRARGWTAKRPVNLLIGGAQCCIDGYSLGRADPSLRVWLKFVG